MTISQKVVTPEKTGVQGNCGLLASSSIMSLQMIRRDHAGFTLVEIMVALAILGLVAVSALPFLQGWKEGIDLRNGAAKVAETMLLARMRSVVERTDYTVSVNYATDVLSATPSVGSTKIISSVDLYFDDSDPDCPALSSGNIDFRANGTADAAGFEAVYLRSRSARVPVRYRVKILGATGKVSVERWAGGDWSGAY
jgi:prepilin-type N-terminal cleavage/methylation domain-containing protein